MAEKETEESLLDWVNTCDVEGTPCTSATELEDGVVLIRIMSQIHPEAMPADAELSAMANRTEDYKNLKILLNHVEDIYVSKFEANIDFQSIKGSLDHHKPDAVLKLVELVLGLAVQCSEKGTYIARILQLDQQSQLTLMYLIEGLLAKCKRSEDDDVDNPLRSPSPKKKPVAVKRPVESQGDAANDSSRSTLMEDMQSENSQMRKRVEELLRERESLREEVATLSGLTNRQGHRDEINQRLMKDQYSTQIQLQELQNQLAVKSSELEKLKQAKDERVEALEVELRKFNDEVDVLRSKAAQVTKLEATVARYKSKLEDTLQLRQHANDLEEQNSKYLERILSLENSVKSVTSLKNQIESYKNKVVELETSRIEESGNQAVQKQKLSRLEEELETVTGAKEFLEEQLEAVREELEDIRAKSGEVGGRNNEGGDANSVRFWKEKCLRLEKHLAGIESGVPSDQSEDIASIQNKLEDALKLNSSLEQSTIEYKQKWQSAETQVSTLKNMLESASHAKESHSAASADASKWKAKAHDLSEELDRMETEKQNLLKELQDQQYTNGHLKKECDELSVKKSKLEEYTRKLLQNSETARADLLSAYKQQIQESEHTISTLKAEIMKMKEMHDLEERLIMSTFYEVGMDLQRRNMKRGIEEGLSAKPSSWLSRKRQEEKLGRARQFP